MVPISIIIPVHKGGQKFIACLESLRALSRAPKEIVVVIDGNDDGSAAAARKAGAGVLELPFRSGPSAARNMGAKRAKGEIFFFVDADVTVHPDALDRIESAFSADPGLSAVIGSYDDSPLEANFLSQFRNLLHHYTHQKGNPEASTFWGACGAIRREAFSSVGGFDEKIYGKPSIEDIDLGYRLKRSGYRIRLIKKLQVKHLKRWNLRKTLKTDLFNRAVPWTVLMIKEERIINDLNVSTSERVNLILSYFILLGVAGSVLTPWLLGLCVYCGMALVWRNRPFYSLIFRIHGLAFLMKGAIFHWFHYLYCGIGFLSGLCRAYLPSKGFSNRSLLKKDVTYG